MMDDKCKLCKNREEMCNDNMAMRNLCKRNGFGAFSPVTNADRIRAMSDEELAKQLCKRSCPPDKYKFHCTKIFSGGTTECEKCWLDYLTQEVTEDACL